MAYDYEHNYAGSYRYRYTHTTHTYYSTKNHRNIASSTITSGFTTSVNIFITIDNPAEDAFQSILSFALPTNLLQLVNIFNETRKGEVTIKLLRYFICSYSIIIVSYYQEYMKVACGGGEYRTCYSYVRCHRWESNVTSGVLHKQLKSYVKLLQRVLPVVYSAYMVDFWRSTYLLSCVSHVTFPTVVNVSIVRGSILFVIMYS